MIEYFIKLNKYQKGIIISLLIFSVSMLGFIFNTNVRLGKLTDDIYDIVIDEPKDIEPEDTDPKVISYDDAIQLLIIITLILNCFCCTLFTTFKKYSY